MKAAFPIAAKHNFYHKITAWWTKGPFGHVDLVLSDDRIVSSVPKFGTAYRNITLDDTYVLIDVEIDPEVEPKIITWIDGELGCKYDYLGAARFVLPWMKESPTRWFCSEFVAKALTFDPKYQVLGDRPYLYNPNQLYNKILEITSSF